MVLHTDAVRNPRTMMVHTQHASVAVLAVMSARRLYLLTFHTEGHLLEARNDVESSDFVLQVGLLVAEFDVEGVVVILERLPVDGEQLAVLLLLLLRFLASQQHLDLLLFRTPIFYRLQVRVVVVNVGRYGARRRDDALDVVHEKQDEVHIQTYRG